MRILLLTLLLPAVFTPALADTSAGKKSESLAESVFEHMLPVIADAAEEDAASAVKGPRSVWKGNKPELVPRGIKNFQGSNTLVRSALSYGILRAAGFRVSQPWAVGGEQIGSALAFFEEKNQKNLEEAFQKLFGRALVKKRSGAGDQTTFTYDSASLEAAFKQLYLAPDATVGGVRAKVVYDTLFKDYVKHKAELIAGILDRKGFVAAASRDYVARSGKPGFDGLKFQDDLAQKLKSPLGDEPRLVGTLVRRHADGTLPAVLKMLRKVLGDYDPATLKALDSKLKSPSV
jgi:hypothetical protein